MSKITDLDERRGALRPEPFKVRDASDLHGLEVPKRDWLVPSVLVRRSVTLFTGDGGVGKSLLLQGLQVAGAIGKDWLGLPVPIMNSFVLYCEDDEDELHRRFHDICKYYGCTFADLEGRVRYISRVGLDNELVIYEGRGDRTKPRKTALFQQILDEIEGYGTQLVGLDTAGDVFGGNENKRSEVRSFVNLIRSFSFPFNGGVILNAHPSKSSMADGSNFSGSTAWHGSVRNRIFLTKPKRKLGPEEEEEGPTDERILRIMKSNYSQGGGKIECLWQNGVIVEKQKRATHGMFERLDDDRKVLDAASYLVKNGTKLAASTMAKNGLIALVVKLPSCRDIARKDVIAAQERLIEKGSLVKVEMGPPSQRVLYLRPAHLRYPGEPKTEAGETAASIPAQGAAHTAKPVEDPELPWQRPEGEDDTP